MLDGIRLHWLLPRDALHISTMQELELRDIASDDSDFDRVGGVNRHWVLNPPRRV